MTRVLHLSPAVESALGSGRPVVALESTIVTHGMPWPRNLEMARRVEAIVREEGAEPATIAVLGGRLKIGLTDDELQGLAQTKDAMKLSRADLAFALATGRNGATTVAATMIAAARAGIRVFATGGIGGVHRGAEESFDISADLEELARTSVIVVCAGAKAILDLKKTLEVLETKGVPVVGYGTDDLPAFWSRTSGLPAPLRLDSAGEIAAFQAAREALDIEGGLLVANPVPAADEIPGETVRGWIEAALAEAETRAISGKAVTPFLLQRIFELSGGRSLETNIALVQSNARLAARIAVAQAQAAAG
ncbi:pseudouridine-5'-phosphate glycosidase [Aurantimonas sp. Leaf443]|uniref:pseudouridine-5'-phosphate glycosidase n=1 Tax=Aurantimonas sp. Leaf443 TaxID=1736378 RepID=UPI0006FE4991|nr:pseudouridine-5'-phosphate glycosidase [Aurantimonas sp. Leaf443]KQT86241.1 pseudouridine-5-phosphate glycosidase [Aurantimonas sp. Leaf443]